MIKTFWIIALVSFINSLSFTILIPTIYPYALQFGLNDFQASLLLSIYALAQFFATPILGKLSDKYGRKWLLVGSLIGTVVAGTVAGFASSAWVLFTARLIDGITGGNNSIAQAVITDVTDDKTRAKGFGYFGAAFGLGFVVGPVLSYLAQQLPAFPGTTVLGNSFLLASLFALLATIITIFFLPETIKTKNKFKLSLKTIGIQDVFTGLLKPKVGRIFLLNFFSGLTFTIFTFTFQPFFLSNLGQGPKTLALFFSMFGAIGVIMQVFGLSKITKKFDLLNILAFAVAVRGLMFILMPSLPFIQAFFVFGIILALVNSFPQAILSTLLSINSKDEEQGINAGLNSSYLSISNAIGPAVGGLLAMLGYSQALFLAGFLTIAVAILAWESKFRIEGSNL